MGQSAEEIKKQLLQKFPKLKEDKDLIVSSKATPNYNCIAWAYGINNKWMWPNTIDHPHLDGVHYWPSKKILSADVSNFIEAFRLKGYELCTNQDFEPGYRKIVLYVNTDTHECTHAARELNNGCWTSKLGSNCDIQHGKPESIENDEYGSVYCIMKRKFE